MAPPLLPRPDLSEAEIQEFREVFDLMDKDKGGTLSADEVRQLMELLGMKVRPGEVEDMIGEIDNDKSGQVDFDEFVQVMARPQDLPFGRSDVLRAFRMFADHDAPHGTISADALEKALAKYCGARIPEEEIGRLIHATMDVNADGMTDYVAKVNLFLNR